MILNLYVDRYTVTKGLSVRVFLQTEGTTSWSFDWLTEKQRLYSCMPALLFTGSKWCWSEAAEQQAWSSCHLCSHLLRARCFICTLNQKREKVLSPFAHAVFHSVLFVHYLNTIWCSRSPEVFAILAVILLTAWNYPSALWQWFLLPALQILRARAFHWLSNFLPSSKYHLLFNALYNLHGPIRNQVSISCGT